MGRYDCIVLGQGGGGSAVSCFLARRGVKTLGIEQYSANHDRASSHGLTRITRMAYWEGPAYVPWLQEAWPLWRELERTGGLPLLVPNGVLMVGGRSGPVLTGALESARRYALPHEILDGTELADRFPQFRFGETDVGLFDPQGGTLFPERCVATFLASAQRDGGAVHFGESVHAWSSSEDGVEVTTARGRYEADHLVIAAGPWTGAVVPELQPELAITRQVVAWFQPARARATDGPGSMPNFLWEGGETTGFYGVADFGDGIKVGGEGGTRVENPASVDRSVSETELAPLAAFVASRLPSATPTVISSRTCLYTSTPDRRFVVGFHPRHPNVVLLSACSGHGFKFTAVLGAAAAELVATGACRGDLSAFSPARFANFRGP